MKDRIRDGELLLASVTITGDLKQLVSRFGELVKENQRLKGRLRSVGAAKTRLRRRLAQS